MELKAGSSSVLPTSPAPLKAILCPLRGRSLPDRLKVGGEVAPFPLRHPFRFHSRRFANVSALRSLPPPTPPLRSLTCGPDPGNERRPRDLPAGADGKAGPLRRRCRTGGRGGGRGRAPSQRPPARGTQPLSAATRAHKPRRRRGCITTPRAPKPRPHWAPACDTPRASRARGVLGIVVLPGPCPPAGVGVHPRPRKAESGCGIARSRLLVLSPSRL